MAQTLTNVSPGVATQLATGTYLDTGTVAAYDFETLGFTPRYVKLVNETSGDVLEWNENMADSEGYKRVAAGTGALITSNGIIPLTNGFTFGLDTDMNVTSEQVSWIAMA